MKIGGIILALWMVLLGSNGFSQAASEINENQEERQLLSGLQANALSETQFKVFQKRAEQKVSDCFEYMQALAGDQYPEDMEAHLRQMTRDLFVEEGTVEGRPVAEFLREGVLSPDLTQYKWQWRGWQSLDQGFTGELKLMASDRDELIHVQFFLGKEIKSFGGEIQEIWTVKIMSIQHE